MDILLRPYTGKGRATVGGRADHGNDERRPEIGFASYDRFFPNQDTIQVSSFGNLIDSPRFNEERVERQQHLR